MSHTPHKALLRGASNFRDLGGYTGLDGRRVRAGQVFRSDHLAGLEADDLQRLKALALTHSIDFRGRDEHAATPYAIEGVQRVALPIEPTVVRRIQGLFDAGRVPTREDAVAAMQETYRDFVLDHSATFGRFFAQLLAHETPQVFHCTAGKDRTGFAAALLLSALGVDRATIEHDYLLTNQLYRRKPEVEGQGRVPEEVRAVLWQVQADFLHTALDTVQQQHGGMDDYLRGPVGLDAQALRTLRERLLQG
jgi:protein-tyrosine phosphatase